MNLDHRFRYLRSAVEELALGANKMAFISGPRQCGKTTFAKQLLRENKVGRYFNWDEKIFRKVWTKDPASLVRPAEVPSRVVPLYIFDEIHKAKGWKATLKGVYDTLETPCKLVITGSAKLDLYKRGGDSLLGRYFGFRLHPFSFGELRSNEPKDDPDYFLERLLNSKNETSFSGHERDIYEGLWAFGPFPEPLLRGSPQFANVWRQGRVETLIREDLRDLSRIPDLSQVEMLVSLLPDRVGSLLSIQSLREDLEVAHDTAKRWMDYLRDLYYLFEIKPYSKSLNRSLKKEGKIYLYDWAEVDSPGPRFENMIACHLLKACQFWTDIGKGKFELRFLRNKEKKEVDFLLIRDHKPWFSVECKLSDPDFDKSVLSFAEPLKLRHHVQVVHGPIREKRTEISGINIQVINVASLLRNLP